MKSLKELLAEATSRLRNAGLADPQRESASLMSFAIGRDHAFLRGHPEYFLTEAEEGLFAEVVGRRARREPFQHISGRQEFYGLDIEVNKEVLIPRPETEFAVETAISLLSHSERPQICDLGTGSGCISIALLSNLQDAVVTAVDISSSALNVAGNNARRHNVSHRMNLLVSDLFEAIAEKRHFDLIISNPPYVPQADFEGLQAEVKNFEPAVALTDGSDGLTFYRRLVREAPSYLTEGGWLVLEFGISQSKDILEMFSDDCWDSVSTRNDLRGIPRVISAQIL